VTASQNRAMKPASRQSSVMLRMAELTAPPEVSLGVKVAAQTGFRASVAIGPDRATEVPTPFRQVGGRRTDTSPVTPTEA
jgi:hypothetical protein